MNLWHVGTCVGGSVVLVGTCAYVHEPTPPKHAPPAFTRTCTIHCPPKKNALSKKSAFRTCMYVHGSGGHRTPVGVGVVGCSVGGVGTGVGSSVVGSNLLKKNLQHRVIELFFFLSSFFS